MSLLHPNDDDEAFARGHADACIEAQDKYIAELKSLLKQARPFVTDRPLKEKIQKIFSSKSKAKFNSLPMPPWDISKDLALLFGNLEKINLKKKK